MNDQPCFGIPMSLFGCFAVGGSGASKHLLRRDMSHTLERLRGGLVASCQPVDDGPMDRPDIVAAMARAAVAGGARGIRIEGVANLLAVRSMVDVPIIGIVKSNVPNTPVRITVSVEEARALVSAGADIVAYDATDRPRTDNTEAVLKAILEAGALAMADCANLEDGKRALSGGASVLGTTLSGYTEDTQRDDDAPDIGLVRAFRRLGGFVMAEGRFDTPDLAALAIEAGADAVTVGSSLTRLEVVSERFAQAIARGMGNRSLTGFAVDLGGTKTAAARIEKGELSERIERSTERTAGPKGQLRAMSSMLSDLGFNRGDRLGVAVTGRVDARGNWYAVNRDTLTGIESVPLAQMLEQQFGPAALINDAAAAALAEHRLGTGRGYANFAYITVSTGVGGGLILNGHLHQSSDGLAGHLGFSSTLNGAEICGSGRLGTVESRAAGWAMAVAAEKAGHPGLDAREVFQRAESGAKWAEDIIQNSAQAIAELSADLVAMLGVERIALGGSIGTASRYRERVQSFIDNIPKPFQAEMVCTSLDQSGPLLGALLKS